MRGSLMLLACCLGLSAQSTPGTTGTGGPSTLYRLVNLARSKRVGTVVMLDADGSLTRRVQDLVTRDPLLEWAVPVVTLSPDQGAGKALRERQGWSDGPRWALMDGEGFIRLEGIELPSATVWADQLLSAGFIDRGQELETFRRKHPESLEALDRLLAHRLSIAQARMAPRLKPPPAPKSGGEPTPAVPELLRPLTDLEEPQIWGACADLLDELLKMDGWQLSLSGFQEAPSWAMRFPVEARLSPSMQDVCRRHLPRLEEALLQMPNHEALWRIWSSMAATAGQRNMRALLDQVVQLPGKQDTLLPPGNVLGDFVQECRAAQDWNTLRETLLPRFERLRARQGSGFTLQGGNASGTSFFASWRMGWDDTVGPLLEACLKEGETSRADEILREVLTWRSGQGAAARAAAVALRCGMDDLAKRWAAFTPVIR